MDRKQELAQFAAILEQKRFVNALEGNISLFDRESGRIYMTPSGTMKLLLTLEDVCVLDETGRQTEGRLRRSSEYRLHLAAYRARADVNAVIHSHCPYLTAYAQRYTCFQVPQSASLREVFQTFVCLPYGKPGTDEIHRGLAQALAGSPICLLGGHGVVCAARDLPTCTGYLEAAENLAKTLFLAAHAQAEHTAL